MYMYDKYVDISINYNINLTLLIFLRFPAILFSRLAGWLLYT